MTPEESEEAARLLSAARSDLRAASLLVGDPGQANYVIGFHAQQAVEKALKAVIIESEREIPFTHDLAFLLEVLADHSDIPPEPVAQADWLTPWAVAARYGASDASLDREAAITVADEAVNWATAVIESGAKSSGR